LDKIPKDVKIILSVGNHDAIRQAEPQPALPKDIREFFSNNVIHVGNPAYVNLDGLKVLIYHGRSLNDLIARIPRLSDEKPHEAMIELLKRRHLCPLYGEKTPIAPEREDWLVIDEVPDVFHSGHVHTYGVGFYRGVFVVNSSTWQAQTEFQKKINLKPNPCNVAIYYNGEVGRLRFCR
jgi:DNA polymerase II small subunit